MHLNSRQGEKGLSLVKNILVAIMMIGMSGAAMAGDERNVIVPGDDDPFVVDKTDFVRLTAKGISGARIETKVEGPAKIETTYNVRELRNGSPMIGNSIKQFDLKPTGTGKVTVTITVTPPIPTLQPHVRKIEYEIK